MRTRLAGIVTVAAFLLVGCGQEPDTITEIENGENGTKVETKDGKEYYLRRYLDQNCETGERLWACAKRSDLLVEQK